MIRNSFDRGPQGWCSYDYHGSIVADGTNVFILATWAGTGGVKDSGYVWTDHRRWSADTPEKPLSILPFLFYRNWIDADPIDLVGTQVNLHLRGDELELDGAGCYFWVYAHGTRWHCTSQPLQIEDGSWNNSPSTVDLLSDESQWHCSWSMDPDRPASLSRVLGDAASYGISFTGFSSEVHGRLSMDEFEICKS
ncbi:MAG: hypothetical protein HN712_30735 [Gemmatimonadetes bacterium]|nr:hypothetical protein [Gemmatimonadota bacterium]MBT6146246.1 hypothetical protein [Gemmatimonadota bacterium]MBT7864723.1 hypothetical protein [Gemmatimonadota bacterium]